MAVIEWIEDQAVDAELDRQLRQLLSLCFTKPCDIIFRDRRYFHEQPRWRWIVRGSPAELIAHIAVHDKRITTTIGDLRIGGIAEVCVHPQHRGQGLIREMLVTIHSWLAAHEVPLAVLFGDKKHYASSGYQNIFNPIRHQNPTTGVWTTKSFDCVMVKPLLKIDWPAGPVDLRGPTF